MKELTFIIKTCERYSCLNNLLKSIRRYYKNVKIIIADDSKKTYKDKILKKFNDLDIEYLTLSEDTGLSYGRNIAVSRVKTKYFCLLDDDFELSEDSNIEKGLEIIKEKKIDILGGVIRTFPIRNKLVNYVKYYIKRILNLYVLQNYTGTIKIKKDKVIINYEFTKFKEYYKTDIVLNFFIAQTNKICNKNLWDEELKMSEHTAFFYKAKLNKLKVASTNTFYAIHCPIRNKKYAKKRQRNYFKLFLEKYNIQEVHCCYEDPKKNYIVYKDKNINSW